MRLSSSLSIARASLLVAGLLCASTAHAQLVVSTGASQTGGLDNRWSISTNGGTSFAPASIVVAPPGQWTSGAPGGIWISASSSGTGGGGSYRIRTTFSMAPTDVFSFNLRCAFDNNPAQMFINGALANANPCGSIWSWGSLINLTQSNFAAGSNTLEFRWSGDNVTDGMAVEISGLTVPPVPGVVPEPSTYALFATGLIGLAALARRRREGAALR